MHEICELLLKQAELQQRGGSTNAARETLELMRECQKKGPYCAEWCQTRAQIVIECEQDPREIIGQAKHAVSDLNDVLDSAFRSGYSVQLAVGGVGSGDRAPKVTINGARQLAWALTGGPERRTALHSGGPCAPLARPAPPKPASPPRVTAESIVGVTMQTANAANVALKVREPSSEGGEKVTTAEQRELDQAVEGAVAALRALKVGAVA